MQFRVGTVALNLPANILVERVSEDRPGGGSTSLRRSDEDPNGN